MILNPGFFGAGASGATIRLSGGSYMMGQEVIVEGHRYKVTSYDQTTDEYILTFIGD